MLLDAALVAVPSPELWFSPWFLLPVRANSDPLAAKQQGRAMGSILSSLSSLVPLQGAEMSQCPLYLLGGLTGLETEVADLCGKPLSMSSSFSGCSVL